MTPPNIPQHQYALLWKEFCGLKGFTPLTGNEMMEAAFFGPSERSQMQARLQREFQEELRQHGFTHVLYRDGETKAFADLH